MKKNHKTLLVAFGCVFIAQQALLWFMVINWSRRVMEIHPLYR